MTFDFEIENILLFIICLFLIIIFIIIYNESSNMYDIKDKVNNMVKLG